MSKWGHSRGTLHATNSQMKEKHLQLEDLVIKRVEVSQPTKREKLLLNQEGPYYVRGIALRDLLYGSVGWEAYPSSLELHQSLVLLLVRCTAKSLCKVDPAIKHQSFFVKREILSSNVIQRTIASSLATHIGLSTLCIRRLKQEYLLILTLMGHLTITNTCTKNRLLKILAYAF